MKLISNIFKQYVTLTNFSFLKNILCTFCLDTKSTKKIKADEKQLKLFERISRKKNSASPQTVFCFFTGVLKFFDAVFHRPSEKYYFAVQIVN